MAQAWTDIEEQPGLLVYRASRLEALLTPLEMLLQAFPPEQALAPQTIIAAHPGMKHWLMAALAKRRGPQGIVANLRVLLASQWLDELARSMLGEGAIAVQPYRREHLRWRVHELLPGLADRELDAYLEAADAPRRRFQLADRLAQLYAQYMVYRPDWLRAWQAGRSAGPASFQAPLWRLLRASIAVAHRGERLSELVSALQEGELMSTAEPLHVFGLSHLAPAELHVLRAVARHRPVALYVPDPCRDYWGGLRGERAQLRSLAGRTVEDDLQRILLQLDHPLLGSWGRMGQHFVLALNEGEDAIRVDTRHWEDLLDDAAARPLLANLQESIRRLHDATLLRPEHLLTDYAWEDRSLRIHACHTPLRELEVLRDVLLMELKQRPDLHPSDIVVMAPDIRRYLPLLPSVFGAPGARNALLPYAVADTALVATHPVFVAFQSLLAVPGSRITVSEVIDLLQVPVVARSLGLDEQSRERLLRWLQHSRVAWGLDAAFRALFEVPATAEHSFAWALDRMLAGYVFGGHDKGFDGVLPLAGVHGNEVQAIGAIDRLLLELAGLHRDSQHARSASAWVQRLLQLIDTLFQTEHAVDQEREAIATLRRLLRRLELETSDIDPRLDFAVVRDALQAALAETPERQRLLRGGVTFCGMVPQRSIPFRVIAVLGLNDGEYPRAATDGAWDLMQKQRRLGDRDVRDDDNYLFLETLMAARDVLHLSFIGEGVRDGRIRNPAAPLSELMQFLDGCSGIAAEQSWSSTPRPWLVRHPLQAFDPRYFNGRDSRLFSFRTEYAAMQPAAVHDTSEATATERDAAGLLPSSGAHVVRVKDLLSFYRDPARMLCTQVLQLRLDALEEQRLSDREPLEARAEAIDRIARRLFFDAWAAGTEVPEVAPDWLALSGMLPVGRLGVAAYRDEREKAVRTLQNVREDGALSGLPPLQATQIDQQLGRWRVQGHLQRVHVLPHGLVVLDAFVGKSCSDLGFRERIPLFVEWALLRLQLRDAAVSIQLRLIVDPSPASVPAEEWPRALNQIDAMVAEARRDGDDATLAHIHADIEARLIRLLDMQREAAEGRLNYFPRTSWAAVQSSDEDIARKLSIAWAGDGYASAGERDYAPGYAGWLRPDLMLDEDGDDVASLRDTARTLLALIDMQTMETSAQ